MCHSSRQGKTLPLALSTDRKTECQELLRSIIEDPHTDEELLFAEDFLGRKFGDKKVGFLTEALRNAEKIFIDEGFFRHPEIGSVEWFRQKGTQAFISENYLWNTLFGLLFWQELFESPDSCFHNQFDYTPFDLVGEEFFKNHSAAIENKLQLLHDREALGKYLEDLIQKRPELTNSFFKFYPDTLALVETYLDHADPNATGLVLKAMACDFHKRSSGFPDLMILENGLPKFIEIKAPGDSLRKNQMAQMMLLKKAGFEVAVLKVEYNANPDQSYVVVDIETTGLSPVYNRITELGAVKIKKGVVVETFQRLINPKQAIPARIQILTGITNAMVESAPSFLEVAEAFSNFTKDSIFVAHNVKFDYGFIQAEFQKLELPYVRPYMCTSAGMKKHYPGLSSYSLGSLTNHFNIELKTHHRALCDAEATAQLLLLINESRRLRIAQN
ncbi:MAG TPA: exonuclease domain-containing protein [Bacteriovoracaceae bacterium]|nr:exonuclease domain-containing protein [Bacteriovoracaceae bacterium]